MSGVKISELPSGSPAQATDEIPIARSGVTYKVPVSSLGTLVAGPTGATGATGATGPTGASGGLPTITQMLLPESAIYPASNYPQFKSVAGTNFPVNSLAFDASTEETCYFRGVAADYGSGNLTIRFRWYADTATSGSVVWSAALAAISPADAQDIETKAFDTAQNASASAASATGQALVEASLTLSNLDSIALRDDITLKIARKTGDAGDDMTGDALLVGIIIEYSAA